MIRLHRRPAAINLTIPVWAVPLLAVALIGGTAWAAGIGASQIARDAVRSRHIKAGNVTTTDIATGAVTSSRIGNGQVGAADLAAGAVTSAAIADGTIAADDLADSAVTLGKLPTVPAVMVSRGVSMSIPNATLTAFQFNGGEVWDDEYPSMFDGGTDNTRIVIPVTGFYQLQAYVVWAGNAGGVREIRIVEDGGNAWLNSAFESEGATPFDSGGNQSVGTSTLAYLTAGDTLQMKVYQSSGGALDAYSGNFQVVFVGASSATGS